MSPETLPSEAISPETLFNAALGLPDPWSVTQIEFRPNDKEIHLHLDFKKGSHFPCTQCETLCSAYDTQERVWRHLNFFEHQAFLHVRFPRIQCPEHGIHTIHAPWARPGSNFTLLFEAFALLLARQSSVLATANLLGIHDKQLWTLIEHHVSQARQDQDLSQVQELGIDEVARQQGHDYLTICTDHDKQRVVAIAPGHGEQAVADICQQLKDKGADPQKIQAVSRDLSPAYEKGISSSFPHARQVADPFHISQQVHRALDQTRRQETKQEPKLKGSRYLWLKAKEDLSDSEKATLTSLKTLPLQTVKAYGFKEEFSQLWEQPDAVAARAFLRDWCSRVKKSGSGEIFIEMASHLLLHEEDILNYHRTGRRLSNGICEAINGFVDELKARARGFKNAHYLQNMIYLTQAKLAFQLPTLNNE